MGERWIINLVRVFEGAYSQPVVLSLRVTFDSLQPSRASSPKMTATKDYSALPLQKYACIAGYMGGAYLYRDIFARFKTMRRKQNLASAVGV